MGDLVHTMKKEKCIKYKDQMVVIVNVSNVTNDVLIIHKKCLFTKKKKNKKNDVKWMAMREFSSSSKLKCCLCSCSLPIEHLGIMGYSSNFPVQQRRTFAKQLNEMNFHDWKIIIIFELCISIYRAPFVNSIHQHISHQPPTQSHQLPNYMQICKINITNETIYIYY